MFRNLSPLAGGVLLILSFQSQAAIVTQFGDNVKFTYDDSSLFGTGTVIGDNIFFLPSDFIAESLNGAGTVTVSDTLDVQVEVLTQGYWLSDLAVFEQGDYQLTGAGAAAGVAGTFSVASNTSTFSDSVNFDAGPLTVEGPLTQWSADALLNLSDTIGWGGDTNVDLSVFNESTATTAALGEEAFVQKKIGGVSIMVSAIPVPAAVWLFGSGLIAMFGFARRKARG